MAACVTGKKMYATKELAEQALVDAWARFDFGKGRGPVTVYQCEDCKQFHLTSTGPMNEKLSQAIRDGDVKLRREAGFWEDKLNKRK